MAKKRKSNFRHKPTGNGNGGGDSPIIIGDSSTGIVRKRRRADTSAFIFIRAFTVTPSTPRAAQYIVPLQKRDTIDQVIVPGLSSIGESFTMTLSNGVTVQAFGKDDNLTINVPKNVSAIVQNVPGANRVDLLFPGTNLGSVIVVSTRTQATSILTGEQIQITLAAPS